jgi:hypothetical protein
MVRGAHGTGNLMAVHAMAVEQWDEARKKQYVDAVMRAVEDSKRFMIKRADLLDWMLGTVSIIPVKK